MTRLRANITNGILVLALGLCMTCLSTDRASTDAAVLRILLAAITSITITLPVKLTRVLISQSGRSARSF